MPPSGAERAAHGVLAEAFARWQDAAGPFWPYVCATPFLSSLAPSPPTAPARRLPPLIARALERAPGPGTAIFVDLPPERTLRLAPLLFERGCVVVPVVQRWVAAPAVVPGERLLAELVARAPTAPPAMLVPAVVFLIDGCRAGRAGSGGAPAARARTPRRVLGRRFDNRYEYPICRFPPPALLAAAGIQQATWAPALIAPDLAPYAARLAAAGIAVQPAGAAPSAPY